MAKIFAQRSQPTRQADTLADHTSAAQLGDASALTECTIRAGPLRNRARQFATAGSARAIDTEHVLAAAVELYPEEATRAFGSQLCETLLQLLEKSQLAPPPADAASDAQLLIAEDAEALLDINSPSALYEALQALPDAAAAVQLIEMAQVFAQRA